MKEAANLYAPGDPVLALHSRAGKRYWTPGVVRSVGPTGARVDLGDRTPRRVPFARLRLAAPR